MVRHHLRWWLAGAALGLILAACGDAATSTTSPAVPSPTTSVTPTTATTTRAATPTIDSSTTTATTPSTTTTTTTVPPDAGHLIEVEIVDGAPLDFRTEEINLDDAIVIRIDSDTADEVHVHGYDLFVEVVPGVTADLAFVADIPGIFEVELEIAGEPILELEVS